MDTYQLQVRNSLRSWQKQMVRTPSIFGRLSKKIQLKINSWIPEKAHAAITTVIKQMIRGVLFGSKITTARPVIATSLMEREAAALKRIEFYRTTAAVEGGVTGAGGFLLALADFPVLIALKLKLLFDLASIYGFDVNDYKERLYLLHIFELAFSSAERRKTIYLKMEAWDQKSASLPEDIHQFDCRICARFIR